MVSKFNNYIILILYYYVFICLNYVLTQIDNNQTTMNVTTTTTITTMLTHDNTTHVETIKELIISQTRTIAILVTIAGVGIILVSICLIMDCLKGRRKPTGEKEPIIDKDEIVTYRNNRAGMSVENPTFNGTNFDSLDDLPKSSTYI
jgi:hypothetical protein